MQIVAGLVQRVLATLARHSAVVPVNDFLNRVLAEAFVVWSSACRLLLFVECSPRDSS